MGQHSTEQPKQHVLTSHELAGLLLAQPDIPVMLEGCDCNGDAGSVQINKGWGPYADTVLICRTTDI